MQLGDLCQDAHHNLCGTCTFSYPQALKPDLRTSTSSPSRKYTTSFTKFAGPCGQELQLNCGKHSTDHKWTPSCARQWRKHRLQACAPLGRPCCIPSGAVEKHKPSIFSADSQSPTTPSISACSHMLVRTHASPMDMRPTRSWPATELHRKCCWFSPHLPPRLFPNFPSPRRRSIRESL